MYFRYLVDILNRIPGSTILYIYEQFCSDDKLYCIFICYCYKAFSITFIWLLWEKFIELIVREKDGNEHSIGITFWCHIVFFLLLPFCNKMNVSGIRWRKGFRLEIIRRHGVFDYLNIYLLIFLSHLFRYVFILQTVKGFLRIINPLIHYPRQYAD